MKMFYEKDANVDLIKSKKVAIFGFGSQGHAHALNLKDSGVKEVVVALREGSSSKRKAESQELRVMSLSDAAEWADIVMMLTPDELQSQIYKNHVEQRMKEGTSIAFAHGLNIHFNLINARKDLGCFHDCSKRSRAFGKKRISKRRWCPVPDGNSQRQFWQSS